MSEQTPTPEIPTMPHVRPSFRRRTFLIKQNFQLPFAFWPIGLMALYLICAAIYLHGYLLETLETNLYMSHASDESLWDQVFPAVAQTVGIGGLLFLVALGIWVHTHFSRLHKDLKALEEWGEHWDVSKGKELFHRIADNEVKLLAVKLIGAAHRFDKWDADIAREKSELVAAIKELENAPEEELLPRLTHLRTSWQQYWNHLHEVHIDEGLS